VKIVQELDGGEAFLSEREGWIVLGFDAARWDSGLPKIVSKKNVKLGAHDWSGDLSGCENQSLVTSAATILKTARAERRALPECMLRVGGV
jgi:hypothetical protein